jgi:Fungal protein kinase
MLLSYADSDTTCFHLDRIPGRGQPLHNRKIPCSSKEYEVKSECPKSLRNFQQHRLVLREIVHPIQSFRNVRELIQVFRDALYGTFSLPASISLANRRIAHRLTIDRANLLHRNITVGNIVITQEGRGILVDWAVVDHVLVCDQGGNM